MNKCPFCNKELSEPDGWGSNYLECVGCPFAFMINKDGAHYGFVKGDYLIEVKGNRSCIYAGFNFDDMRYTTALAEVDIALSPYTSIEIINMYVIFS